MTPSVHSHARQGPVKLQLGALLHSVLDVDLPAAVGGEGGAPEAARTASRIPLVTSWAKFSP